MRGEVDVHNVLLAAPTEPGAPGRPYTVRGRAALPAGQSVAIEADTGAGFKPAGTATVENDGSFATDVIPSATATYRAVAGADASPGVQLLVLNRKLTASGSTRGRRRGRQLEGGARGAGIAGRPAASAAAALRLVAGRARQARPLVERRASR